MYDIEPALPEQTIGDVWKLQVNDRTEIGTLANMRQNIENLPLGYEGETIVRNIYEFIATDKTPRGFKMNGKTIIYNDDEIDSAKKLGSTPHIEGFQFPDLGITPHMDVLEIQYSNGGRMETMLALYEGVLTEPGNDRLRFRPLEAVYVKKHQPVLSVTPSYGKAGTSMSDHLGLRGIEEKVKQYNAERYHKFLSFDTKIYKVTKLDPVKKDRLYKRGEIDLERSLDEMGHI
ncbi:hypothetical protein GOV11_00555 [Candidatus Woesearchaeota archaeon]|nr:hypothetical protein [Candidatus Woesearchaeota archaeon]